MANRQRDMGQSPEIDPKPESSTSQSTEPDPELAGSKKIVIVKLPGVNPFTATQPTNKSASVPQNQDQADPSRKGRPTRASRSTFPAPSVQTHLPVVSDGRIAVPRSLEPSWCLLARSPPCPPRQNPGPTVPTFLFNRKRADSLVEGLETHYIEDPSVYRRTEGSMLTMETFLKLSCSHMLEIKCEPTYQFNFSSTMEVTCVAPCSRIYPCGHPCRLFCFEECRPCEKNTLKTYKCGHSVEIPCVDLGTNSDVCKVCIQDNNLAKEMDADADIAPKYPEAARNQDQ